MSAAIGKIRKFIRSYITIILLTGALFHAHLSLRVLFAPDDVAALQLNRTLRIISINKTLRTCIELCCNKGAILLSYIIYALH